MTIFFQHERLVINRVTTGSWKQHCYIIINKATSSALIIDPGANAEEIMARVSELNACPKAIVNTHAHYDHVGAVAAIAREFAIPFYLHSKDHRLLKRANLYMKIFDGETSIEVPEVNYFLDDVDNPLNIDVFDICIIQTPGHTNGSCCILLDDVLLTGDTLFKGDVGRDDLPDGNKIKLKESLSKLAEFPGEDNIYVYPGHGEPTVLQEEIDNNIKLKRLLLE